MTSTISAPEYAEKMIDIYNKITEIQPLSISEKSMTLFSQFLDMLSNNISESFAREVLSQPQLDSIRPKIYALFAHASSAYENHWAEQILNADDPSHVFNYEYPYLNHYTRAVGLELSTIQNLSPTPVKKILMAGSGPLPVTSLMLAGQGVQVTNLDICESSLNKGKEVSRRIRPATTMQYLHADIATLEDIAQYDVIWLAALAGDKDTKKSIIENLYKHLKPGAFVVLRTAYNLRALLYPQVQPEDLAPLTLKLKIQTYSDNFHSMLIAQKV